MDTATKINGLQWLRQQIIGRNMLFNTPFGQKPLVYADYTASGRALTGIEAYATHLLQFYANTHTEDDFTGKTMTTLLHQAEQQIKNYVNAGPTGKIVFTGSGATGAITRLQQILGINWPPATQRLLDSFHGQCFYNNHKAPLPGNEKLKCYFGDKLPIILVGPYEHHSNEIMWRHTIAEVHEVPLNTQGDLDLTALEQMLANPAWQNRCKIGSFSASSNVSGLLTPVYDVAKILHRYGAIACFDFAACAPYVTIDMNRDEESYFDAIFFSPHKFIGGPGSSGILVFNEKIYQKDLPPTIAAGGTVDFVNFESEGYIDDIETREKPGTPGIMQGIRAALAFKVKHKVGIDTIEEIENHYLCSFIKAFKDDNRINFYGPIDPHKKINIIAFNIGHKDKILHPKFVTRLLNDLFGIQTRAGCSCAGPYGHRLLNIDSALSQRYVDCIVTKGFAGFKPGWVRLNMHYSLNMHEFDYIVKAVKFVADYGYKFLPQYKFNQYNGDWVNLNDTTTPAVELDLDPQNQPPALKPCVADNDLEQVFNQNLSAANQLAAGLPTDITYHTWDSSINDLAFFYCCKVSCAKGNCHCGH